MKAPLRIGIPVVGGPHWMAGVTYVEMLARSAHTLAPEKRPELYLVATPDSLPHVELHFPFLSLFRGVILLLGPGIDSAPFRAGSLTVCQDRRELFRKIDFYYPVIGDAWPECSASWIPDFQHRFMPEFFSERERAERDAAFGRVAAQARLLVLSSATVREDFRRLYPASGAVTRVLSFFSGADASVFRGDPVATGRKYGLPDRFLLCCNQFWMHKDHPTLFQALANLRKAGLEIPLVCTGSTSDYRSAGYFDGLKQTLASLGIADAVRILGMIPREDQLQLIRRSCALVQPSRFEGWSSIVEDARSLGKFIFLTDLEVHKEQAPPDARFFRAGDAGDLAAALEARFPGLPPGPDGVAEARARAGTDERAREFGRVFLALAEEAISLHTLHAAAGGGASIPVPAGRPAEAGLLHGQGLAKRARGDSQGAMQCFVEALKADPEHAPAVLDLGKSLRQASMHDLALRLQLEFLGRNPGAREVAAEVIRQEEEWAGTLLARCRVRDLNYRPKDYAVTALVSTYASAAFMRECLEDLEAQSLAGDLEIIVVDAASPEGEDAIVEEFQKRYGNIRYIRTPERIGIYPAWNLAIHVARGRFLTPFSTNDRLNPRAYEILAGALEAHPDAALAYGDTCLTELPHQTFAAHAKTARFGGVFAWPAYWFEDLLHNCRIGPHPMWRREVHSEVGRFDGKYKAIGDQDFWLRLGSKHEMIHVPEFTGLAWITEKSLSGESGAEEEIREIQSRHLGAYLARREREIPAAGSKGKVTAIVLASGDSEALQGCLRDLAAQTLAARGALDILVVGAGSDGNAAEAAARLDGGPRIGFLDAGSGTPGMIRNRAVKAASGDYLVLLEPDDRFRADALEAMAAALDSGGEGMVHADILLTRGRGETFARNTAHCAWVPPVFSVRQALVACPFGRLAMWRRSLHRGLGLFDPYLEAAAEHEFFLRVALSRGIRRLDEALCLRVESGDEGRRRDANREAARFLRDARRSVPLASIYPALAGDLRPEARGAAALDFGALLLDPRGPCDPGIAEFHFRNAMADLGNVPEALYDLSLALFDQGRQAEAKPLLAELASRHPEFLRKLTQDGAAAGGIRLILRRDHAAIAALPRVRFADDFRVPLAAYRPSQSERMAQRA